MECDNKCGAICLIAPLRPQGGAIKQIARRCRPQRSRIIASKTISLSHFKPEAPMLRKLRDLILPDARTPRECEACGKPFVCGASLKGCWCFQIKLSAEARNA